MKSILLMSALLLVAGPATAMDQLAQLSGPYALSQSSRIGFTVDQVGGGGIAGTIGEVSGRFVIDKAELSRSTVELALKPATVATGEARVDDFLKSDAIFDAANHPVITFRSTKIVQEAPNRAKITGLLTARGRTNQETFQASLVDGRGGNITFHVVGDIFRSRYGMDAGTPIYSNVVRFDMVLDGRRAGTVR